MVQNAGIADSNAIDLPDFQHYATRGLLPAVPADVTAAIANHQNVIRQYRKAQADKAAAQATVSNGQAALSRVIFDAVVDGLDPTEGEAQVRAELESARRALDDSTGAAVGYIRAANAAAGRVMEAIEEWAPVAVEHLAGPMTKTAAKLDRAKAAYDEAVAAHRELEAIANWINGVRLEPGALFPNTLGLATLNPDPDSE